jgi:rhamnopyranosyl-N-acetylglucosaminyl-diphospho-decaprenol beta-1,3/1,4-galactofuranosyltransferase
MSEDRPPRVAAVVITYNRCDVVRKSLARLVDQTRPVDEVIVVDNASKDHTADMVAYRPADVVGV